MSISETYSETILEQIIKEILDEDITLSTSEINKRYQAFILNKDLSKPLMVPSLIVANEISSATKYNETNFEIARDLTVLYQEILKITDDSIKSFDRWRTETLSMQAQIKALDTRITDLLRTQIDKTSNFIADDFIDTSKIDLDLTDAFVNLNEHTISLSKTNRNPTRIILNNLDSNAVQFTILSRTNLQSVTTVAPIINAFDDRNNFWQTRVLMKNSRNPVTAELKVQLAGAVQPISKIIFTVHSSNSGSAMQITPLISTDGVNFSQLNTSNITQSITTKGVWSFPSTDVLLVKFIITKTGYDVLENNNFIYEYGAQDISFYNESFSPNLSETFFSTVLTALDTDKNPIEFDSVELEVCERIPTNTNIDYFISALSSINDSATWISIDQIAKENPIHSKKVNFGNIDNIKLDRLKVSYHTNGTPALINPSGNFSSVAISSGSPVSTPTTIANSRYIFVNTNDRILDSQISNTVDIIQQSIEIFRNVGAVGNRDLVRGIQRGWSFLDPYYISAIEVSNENGFLVDFGDQSVIFDNNNITGRFLIPTGIHNIKVHKNNWINIPNGITTLDDLKLQDPLFPFNHKYIIEGYSLDAEDNPYIGADIFAGYFMKQVSIYDFCNNVSSDDYTKFAIDTDATQSTVFVIKSNENMSDFLDEEFTIRFDVKNQLYKYLKFKAQLTTQDENVTPNLDGYKLKIST